MCTNPKKAFQIGYTRNGKPSYLICDKEVHHLEKGHKGYWNKVYDSRIFIGNEGAITEYIEVPCGRCLECRLAHSKQWADRCLLEMQYHESNLFVTLTYDDDHIPMRPHPDAQTGEITDKEFNSLSKRDLQLFFKRLRKKFGNGISYYACGEYGSNTIRPHYHAIIFGLKLDDLIPFYTSGTGNQYCLSETLARIWQLGQVTVSEATYENAAYTARYVMKKAENPKDKYFYENNNIEKEFVTMSRRPAIGLRWFEEHPNELYENLFTSIGTEKGGYKIRRNRYFDKKMDIYNPVLLKMVKDTSISFMNDKDKLKLAQTSLSRNEQFEVEQDALAKRLKALERKEI